MLNRFEPSPEPPPATVVWATDDNEKAEARRDGAFTLMDEDAEAFLLLVLTRSPGGGSVRLWADMSEDSWEPIAETMRRILSQA